MTIELADNQDKAAILDRLAPGMQVMANIIVRQRPVITLLTDVFTRAQRACRTAVESRQLHVNCDIYCRSRVLSFLYFY